MSWLEGFADKAHASLNERALDALASRGVDEDQAKLFRVGFLGTATPRVGDEAFDRWAQNYEERLQDVFVLPLTNALGQVKGFQFRGVDRGRKGYLDFFLDPFEPVLFGLGQAMPALWRDRAVWLVEGAFDLLPLQRLRPNALSVLTANANPALVRLLRRVVDRVYLAYDNDEAGRRGVQEFYKLYGQAFDEVRPFLYPRGVVRADGNPVKDPSDLWEAWGDEPFDRLLRCMEAEE